MNNRLSETKSGGVIVTPTKCGLLNNQSGARFNAELAKRSFDKYLRDGGFSTGVIQFTLGVGLMKNINKVSGN